MKLTRRKKQLVTLKEPECYNCGHPFSGHEKFCPDCGQKNKRKKITFKSFLAEVFNGFISWDAKFWKTLIPLLTKPGKVSRDFIDGKRARYSNPFQFYLTVSIVFFLILGIVDKYHEFSDVDNGRNDFAIVDLRNDNKEKIDSTINKAKKNIEGQLQNLDSVDRAEILSVLPSTTKDTSKVKSSKDKNTFNFINKEHKVTKMVNYQRDHPKVAVDSALTVLEIQPSLTNRFLYSRANKINSFLTNTSEENKKLQKEIISLASVSIFIFLPIFTLFLRFVYIRRKFTYVEHLIFVFHTQTVFFILLTIFYILSLVTSTESTTFIFSIIFLIYLLIAMKKFYLQGYFKTFIKFIMINFAFVVFGSIGFAILSMVTFMIY
ncbi:MAG: DUF3667 domain-containing protein [Flavobacteriaceae bacterium]